VGIAFYLFFETEVYAGVEGPQAGMVIFWPAEQTESSTERDQRLSPLEASAEMISEDL
jgi:hypothetical protein